MLADSVLIQVPVGGDSTLSGDLFTPPDPRGLVLFAHGNGSSRLSPRNRHVARMLQRGGLATLLMDLLTPEEEWRDQLTPDIRFDISLLGHRLADVVDWLEHHPRTRGLPVGLFGASTGAAAALVTAAARPDAIAAVVSRGGRTDLAGAALERVTTPTLLVVGGRDVPLIGINRAALTRLQGPKRLAVVPGAGHLFEEPGTLDAVARLAREWFLGHLIGQTAHENHKYMH